MNVYAAARNSSGNSHTIVIAECPINGPTFSRRKFSLMPLDNGRRDRREAHTYRRYIAAQLLFARRKASDSHGDKRHRSAIAIGAAL